MANWFVSTEVVRLNLTDDDWIEIKKELSYAEEQRLVGAGITKWRMGDLQEGGGDATVGIDMESYEIKRLMSWLIDWSLCDTNDKRVPIDTDEQKAAAIAALTPAAAEGINDAITKHILAVEASKKANPRKRAAATKSS